MRDSRHTRRAYGACAVLSALAALLLVPSPAAAVDPAVSQYSLNFPNAKGKSYPGSETPTATPKELLPIVRRALSDSRREDGNALAAIATASELGAPDAAAWQAGGAFGSAAEIGNEETPSVPAAVSDALDDPPVILGLLALLGLIAYLGFLARGKPTRNEA